MKLSSFHKANGDVVEWWEYGGLLGNKYDKIYSSKVFDFTPENPYLPENVIKGGTGYGLYEELPPEIDRMFPDYSLYPECDYALGFITRGCPNNCRWCVVPKKEGKIRPYADWRNIVRQDTKKLTLLDNNILACDYGIQQLEELSHTDYKVDLNQGMDARLMTPEIAKILAAIKWQQFIRFSCDSKAQVPAIERVIKLLTSARVSISKIHIYFLVTSDIYDAVYRIEQLKRIGIKVIYAQAEQNPSLGITPNRAMKEFACRYIYGRLYFKETWEQYCGRHGFPPYDGDLGNVPRKSGKARG